MTEFEIFKKSVYKAFNNGYLGSSINLKEVNWYRIGHNEIMAIIFSHDFAKAFWSEERMENLPHFDKWAWHLQQMVLEEHPLKYLEDFL